MSKALLIAALFLGTLFGAHLAVYFSAVRLMPNATPLTKALLLIFLLLVPCVFPATWAWNRVSPGFWPGILHASCSIWLGFVLYFVMALPVLFMARAGLRLFDITCSEALAVRVCAAGALLVVLYGFIGAKNPRVHNVRVYMRNLPAHWEGKKIVQLSDVHLGAIHGRGFLRKIVRRVNELEPDLAVITGDLFDAFAVNPSMFAPGLAGIQAKQGVYFVTGNHEGYIGVDKALRALDQTGIRVLDNEAAEIDGLQLVGMSYPLYNRTGTQKDPFTDSQYRRDLPTILLFHTPTSPKALYADRQSQQLTTYFSPDTSFKLAKDAGVDLQLSGHTHAGQLFPFNLLTSRLFKGFDRGLHTLDDFAIYISPGTGTWGPPLRIGTRSEITLIALADTALANSSDKK